MTDKRGIGLAILYAAVAALIIGLVVVLAQLRQLAGSNSRALQLIEACTTVGGECYERGQKNTADVVGSLNQFTIYVLACADQPGEQTVDEITACALDKAEQAD